MSLLYILLAASLAAGFMSPSFAGGICINLVQKACKQMDCGNYTAAISTLVLAVRQDPSDLEARRHLCSAMLGAGKAKEALHELQVINQAAPGDLRDLQMMAEAHYQCGDSRAAIQKYREALAADPAFAPAKIGLIRTLISSGKSPEAEFLCKATLRSSTDSTLRKQVNELLQLIRSRSSYAAVEEMKG